MHAALLMCFFPHIYRPPTRLASGPALCLVSGVISTTRPGAHIPRPDHVMCCKSVFATFLYLLFRHCFKLCEGFPRQGSLPYICFCLRMLIVTDTAADPAHTPAFIRVNSVSYIPQGRRVLRAFLFMCCWHILYTSI